MVTRDKLNQLTAGEDWIVITCEKRGRRRALFNRVTRAGKGNDVVVDVPKVGGSIRPSDYVRQVIPIGDVLSIVRESAARARKGTKRKVAVTEVEAWRALAEDAIKALRRFVEDSDDEARASGFRTLGPLERRQSQLAGQTEMFP